MNHRPHVLRPALGVLLGALLLAGCGRDAGSRIEEAREARADGKLQAALIELKNALKDDPANLEARVLLGEVSLQAGDPATAVKEFQKSAELGAQGADFVLAYGAALRETGNFEELVKLLADAKGDTPQQAARLEALKAEAAMGLGKGDDARAALAAATAADATLTEVRLAQARYELGAGRLDEAQQQLDALAGDARAEQRYWELRAQLALRRNDPKAAAAAYREGIAAITDTFGVRKFILQGALAEVLLASGDVPAARKELAPMLEQAPRHPLPNYLRARADYQEGKYEDALAHAQAALSAVPGEPQVLMLAGAAAIKLGQRSQGESFLVDAVRAAPDNLAARQLLAEARLGRGAAAEAVEALLPAFEAGSSDPGLLALLGQASAAAGSHDSAIALYRRRLAEEPDNQQVRLYLAASLIASGRADDASRELAKVTGGDANERLRVEMLSVIARLRDGDLAGAREQAAAIRKAQAGNADALYTLGTLFMAARAWDDARGTLDAALAANPRHLPSRLQLGRLDAVTGNPDGARTRFNAVLKDEPRNVDAMVALAALALGANDPPGAKDWLEKARKADNAALAPRLLLADLYLREQALPAARAVADEAVAADRGSAQAANALGVVMATQGEVAGARTEFARAVDLAPTWPEARYNAARAELALGKVDDARKSLEAAIALDPGYVNALALLIAVELRSERVNEAARHLEALKRRQPDTTLTRLLEGDVLLAQKRPKDARAVYAAALAKTDDRRAAFGVYRAALAENDPEATRVLEQWLAAHPTDQAARFLLAEAHHQAGDKARAIAGYEKILADAPDNVAALNNLAVLYQETGDKRAAALARKAWALAPQSGAVADTLGWILHQQGEREKALELLRKAAELSPELAEIRYHLAVALADGGEAAEARRVAEELLADENAVAFHDRAQALLGKLKPVT